MTTPSVTETRNHRVARIPSDADLIGPVCLSCPRCDTDLDYQLRVTLTSAWSASKRPPAPEAYVVCPSCRKAWIAGLWLSSAAYVAEGRAA